MLTKKVNGETVILSSKEESAVRAEWAANEAARSAEDTAKVDAITARDAALATGAGIVTREEFTRLQTLVASIACT